MSHFAKPSCCINQSFRQVVPIVLCKIACATNEQPHREAKKASEVLKLRTGSDGLVVAKDVQSSPPEAEVFDEVEDFFRFLQASRLWFLCNDDVQIDVSMDKITIR